MKDVLSLTTFAIGALYFHRAKPDEVVVILKAREAQSPSVHRRRVYASHP